MSAGVVVTVPVCELKQRCGGYCEATYSRHSTARSRRSCLHHRPAPVGYHCSCTQRYMMTSDSLSAGPQHQPPCHRWITQCSHSSNRLKLEGCSAERIYLWQRCSDASVNKTILKPWLAVVACREFPDVKFHVAVHIRDQRKQSCSGIRTMIRIRLKS